MRNLLNSRLMFQLKYASNFQRCLAILILLFLIVYALLIPAAQDTLKSLTNTPSLIRPLKQIIPNENSQARLFYQHLPNSNQVKEMLAHFYNTAETHGLEVSTVQYALEESPDVSFATYKLSAPIYGEYLDIMQLVKTMLENYSTLALTKLNLVREDKKENLVSAEVEFVIYMKKDN